LIGFREQTREFSATNSGIQYGWNRLVAKRATNLISCDNPSGPPVVGGLNSAQEHSWAWGRTVQKWGTQKWMVYIKKNINQRLPSSYILSNFDPIISAFEWPKFKWSNMSCSFRQLNPSKLKMHEANI